MKKITNQQAFIKLKKEKFTTFCSFRVYKILVKLLGRKVKFVELRVQNCAFEAIEINGLFIVPEYGSET